MILRRSRNKTKKTASSHKKTKSGKNNKIDQVLE